MYMVYGIDSWTTWNVEYFNIDAIYVYAWTLIQNFNYISIFDSRESIYYIHIGLIITMENRYNDYFIVPIGALITIQKYKSIVIIMMMAVCSELFENIQ